MVLFLPAQQELDCIGESGQILGQIRFDALGDEYTFVAEDASQTLSHIEQSCIAKKLASLVSGQSSIPMQDDD